MREVLQADGLARRYGNEFYRRRFVERTALEAPPGAGFLLITRKMRERALHAPILLPIFFAEALGVDEVTIKAHLGRMLRKTGSGNRVELSLRAAEELASNAEGEDSRLVAVPAEQRETHAKKDPKTKNKLPSR